MPTGAVNESVFENAVIEVLKKTGWEHVYGPDLKGRDYREPICYDAFRQMVHKLNRDTPNGHISNEKVIKRLIELAQRLKSGIEATPSKLTEDEAAFYDALAKPDAVKKCFSDETLIALTKELTDQLRRNRTVDWDKRDDARAHMRRLVKTLLRKYKYPPKEAEDALNTVIRQCELWVDETPMEAKNR